MEEERKSVVPIPVATPAAAQKPAEASTDTGNLEVLDDTATRKTVKLKPVVPRPEINPANRLSITPAAPGAKLAAPVIKAPTSEVEIPKPAAPTAGLSEEDKTVKVQRMPRKPAAAETSPDKATVKLPSPASAPAAAPAAAKPPMTPPPRPAAPRVAPARPVPARPAPDPEASEPTAKLPMMNKSAVPTLSDSGESDSVSAAAPAAGMPAHRGPEEEVFGSGCSAMQVFSMILVACAVVMMVLQFVDILYGTDFASFIPGMQLSK